MWGIVGVGFCKPKMAHDDEILWSQRGNSSKRICKLAVILKFRFYLKIYAMRLVN